MIKRMARPLIIEAINDTFGHLAGGEVLRILAQCCHDGLLKLDTIVRYGGKRFVILLIPETGLSEDVMALNTAKHAGPGANCMLAARSQNSDRPSIMRHDQHANPSHNWVQPYLFTPISVLTIRIPTDS